MIELPVDIGLLSTSIDAVLVVEHGVVVDSPVVLHDGLVAAGGRVGSHLGLDSLFLVAAKTGEDLHHAPHASEHGRHIDIGPNPDPP